MLTATEREVLLDPGKLDRLMHRITVEGTALSVADLRDDSRMPEEVVAGWREAANRYAASRYAREQETNGLAGTSH